MVRAAWPVPRWRCRSEIVSSLPGLTDQRMFRVQESVYRDGKQNS